MYSQVLLFCMIHNHDVTQTKVTDLFPAWKSSLQEARRMTFPLTGLSKPSTHRWTPLHLSCRIRTIFVDIRENQEHHGCCNNRRESAHYKKRQCDKESHSQQEFEIFYFDVKDP